MICGASLLSTRTSVQTSIQRLVSPSVRAFINTLGKPVPRQSQLQLFAQALDVRDCSVGLRRSPFSHQRAPALNLRPNSDFFVIYNQSTGVGLERPSYSLQFKLTRDFTF